MIKGTIEFTGRRLGDVEAAVERALDMIRADFTSGMDRNEDGSVVFEMHEELPID